MRKKMLSLALTLVMCLGLTVPAFAASSDKYSANGYTDPASENVTFSVAPIGVATIRGEISYEDPDDPESSYHNIKEFTAYVFDQDCLVTRKDGRPLTHFVLDDGIEGYYVNIGNENFPYARIEVAGISAEQLWLFQFGTDSDDEADWSPWMMSKKALEAYQQRSGEVELGASVTVVEYRPLSGQSQPTVPTVGNFTDVKTGDYFADPVLWAVEKKITAGTSTATFSPDATCTQGQILTFLWRAKGEPAPSGTVSGSEFYAKAAQWAKEQGLTDIFFAEADCTRAMVVTYLWKLAGSPKTGTSNFSDVSADADYAQAVAWAVEQGITSGTGDGTTFSPDETCTRGQIATFLYRAFAE